MQILDSFRNETKYRLDKIVFSWVLFVLSEGYWELLDLMIYFFLLKYQILGAKNEYILSSKRSFNYKLIYGDLRVRSEWIGLG